MYVSIYYLKLVVQMSRIKACINEKNRKEKHVVIM